MGKRYCVKYWWADVRGICWLALSMWRKLKRNRHKAHWTENGDYNYFRKCADKELFEADMMCGPSVDRQMEFADVANFAMMLHELDRRALKGVPSYLGELSYVAAPSPGAKQAADAAEVSDVLL